MVVGFAPDAGNTAGFTPGAGHAAIVGSTPDAGNTINKHAIKHAIAHAVVGFAPDAGNGADFAAGASIECESHSTMNWR